MLKIWKENTRFKTRKSIPNQMWVPHNKIIYLADILKNKVETPVMVHGQQIITIHDRRKVYVQKPNPQGRKIMRKLEG